MRPARAQCTVCSVRIAVSHSSDIGRSLFVREEFAKQYDIRTSMSEAESTSDQRKRRFEYDENDADKRKKEKRYPCEDSYLTPEERRNEVTPQPDADPQLMERRVQGRSHSATLWWMPRWSVIWSACGTSAPCTGLSHWPSTLDL